MTDPFDIWLAGFLDGEASICIYKSHRWLYVSIDISQHKRAKNVLKDIQKRYGGHLRLKKPARRSAFTSGFISENVMVLTIRSSSQVIALLEATVDHMRVKGDKAREALNTLARINRPRHRLSWTAKEDATIRQSYGYGAAALIAAQLNRSVSAVRSHAKYMKHRVCLSS